MSNFRAMIDRIADELDDGGIEEQIKREINSAIRQYSTKRLFLTERSFTFTTVANQPDYDIDDAADIDTFLEVQDSYVTVGGIRYPMTPIDYPTLSASQNGIITSERPTNWAFFARAFWLFPIPTGAAVVTISGHCRFAVLSGDTDTNAWMTDGEELIRARAKRRLAANVTKDLDEAQSAGAQEIEALDALERETRLRRGRRVLRVDPALMAPQPYNIQTG